MLSFVYFSAECLFNKFYGINCRSKLDAKLFDRFVHLRRQVSPVVNNAMHRFFDGYEHAMERSRMLAELGYVAMAADMFGDRRQAKDLQEARALIAELRDEPAKLRARARTALATLAWLPQVDAERLGAIGFCFGGSVVLELARDGADLKAVVSFHGVLTTKAPAVAGKVNTSVLVCTGADDPLVPPAQLIA